MRFSSRATLDLEHIYEWTFRYWGGEQAEHYHEFLVGKMIQIESGELRGTELKERLGFHSYLAIWVGAKNGHRIIYKESFDGIVIIRVLHSAMDYYRQIP